MGNVKFIVDAQTAKAVNAFMKVVASQKKMESGFRKSISMGKRLSKGLNKMRSGVNSLVGGILGAAGLKMAIGGMVTSLDNARKSTIQFENEMTGLLSLGANIDNIAEIKRQVLDMSGGFGIATKQIADAMFNLQSGSAGLSKEIRKGILKSTIDLVKVTGTEMPVAMNAILKSYQIYGSETNTVEKISAKLFKTAELGAIRFEDMAKLLPDVESAAKTFGFSLDEVGAAVIVMTQKMGKTDKALTSLRNIFLSMAQAEKKGIKLTGTFTNMIQQLSKVDPKVLLEIFGKENIAGVGALIAGVTKLGGAMETLAGVQDSIISEKFLTRLKDASFLFSESSKSIQTLSKNMNLTKGYVGDFGRFDTQLEIRKLGIKRNAPQFLHDVPGLVTGAALFSQFFGTKEPLEAGKRELFGTLERTGQFEKKKQIREMFLDPVTTVRDRLSVAAIKTFRHETGFPMRRDLRPPERRVTGEDGSGSFSGGSH